MSSTSFKSFQSGVSPRKVAKNSPKKDLVVFQSDIREHTTGTNM